MLFKDLPRDALIRPLTRNEVVGMLLRLTIFGAATYYSIKWVVEAMDPTTKQKSQAKKRVHGTKHVRNIILLAVAILFNQKRLRIKRKDIICLFGWYFLSLCSGRAADEEDWCRGGQTDWIWNEYCISSCGSTHYEGGILWPAELRWLLDVLFK